MLPMEKILLMCRGRLQEGGGVHKKLISFIKVTRSEPTNQLNLEYVTYYIVYIYMFVYLETLREAWHINYAHGNSGRGRQSGRGIRQIDSHREWGGGNRHKSSSLKKLNGICIKLKNKSNEESWADGLRDAL